METKRERIVLPHPRKYVGHIPQTQALAENQRVAMANETCQKILQTIDKSPKLGLFLLHTIEFQLGIDGVIESIESYTEAKKQKSNEPEYPHLTFEQHACQDFYFVFATLMRGWISNATLPN